MKQILFVDDEIKILKSLKRLFRDTEYEIVTTESPQEALEIMKEKEIGLVVSDMRMPAMDGYEFLTKVKEINPNLPRIILSGYSDKGILLKALEENVAMAYLLKPWKNDELVEVMKDIFRGKGQEK
jgi:DNA-binding NtrC family response regulator